MGALIAAAIAAYIIFQYANNTSSESESVPSVTNQTPGGAAPIVSVPVSATSTASNSAVVQQSNAISEAVPFVVPVPSVPVPVTPEPILSDYGGSLDSQSGEVFDSGQGAVDFANNTYLATIRPYMVAGDAATFIQLYGTIFDPSRNPILAQQMKDIGADVYAYFEQLQAAAPSGLTLAGLEMYYSKGLAPADFFSWAQQVSYSDPNQVNSWFIAQAPDPMQDLSSNVQTDSGAFTVGQLVDMYNSAAAALNWLPISAVNIDTSGNINITLQNGNSGVYSPSQLLVTIQSMQSSKG